MGGTRWLGAQLLLCAVACGSMLFGCDRALGLGGFESSGPGESTDGDGGSGQGGYGGTGGTDIEPVDWASAWGGPSADALQAMAYDGERLWLAGIIDGDVTFNGITFVPLGPTIGRRPFVVAIDDSGTHLLGITGQRTNADVVAMAVQDGEIVIVTRGTEQPFGSTFQPPDNAHGFVTVLTETNDGLMATYEYPLFGQGGRVEALALSGGNIVIGGSIEGDLIIDAEPMGLPAGADSDAFVVGFTAGATPTKAFAHRLGGEGQQQVTALAAGESALYVAGGFANTLSGAVSPLTASSDSDVFALVLDSGGAMQRATSFGGGGAQLPTVLRPTADGVVMAGWFEGTLGFDEQSLKAIDRDVFVASLDAELAPTLAWRFGGQGQVEPTAVDIQGGEVVVTGWFDGTFEEGGGKFQSPQTSHGLSDGFVAHFDEATTRVGLLTFGRGSHDAACCMLRTEAGLWLGGYFEQHLGVTGIHEVTAQYLKPGFGDSDAFAMRLDDW